MDINTQNIQVNLEMKFQNQKENFGTKIENQNYSFDSPNIKNWGRSIKSTQRR